MNNKLLHMLLKEANGEERELVQMLASMLIGQDDDEDDDENYNERVVLSDKAEENYPYLTGVIQNTVELLDDMREDIELLQAEYKEEYSSDEDGKTTLSDVDELFLTAQIDEYCAVKDVTDQFIRALLQDCSGVVEVIDDEDYDGCRCVVCSVQAQVLGE